VCIFGDIFIISAVIAEVSFRVQTNLDNYVSIMCEVYPVAGPYFSVPKTPGALEGFFRTSVS